MVKPVYAFIGEDSFLQLEKLGEVLGKLGKDVQRIDVDGERAELSDVLDEARSFAMFGGSKLIVLRNADGSGKDGGRRPDDGNDEHGRGRVRVDGRTTHDHINASRDHRRGVNQC